MKAGVIHRCKVRLKRSNLSRRLLPAWLYDVRRILWLTKEFESTVFNRSCFAIALLFHRIIGLPKNVRMQLGGGRPPIFLRPYRSDLEVVLALFKHSEYSPVSTIFGKIETVIDLGSNIGASIRLWSDWFGGATIVGVEPDPENYEIANKNIRIGRNSKVQILRKAVHATNEQLTLSRQGEPWAFQALADAGIQGLAVETITMPELIKMMPGRHADLVKCDIEGGEATLFADCAPWIGCVSNVVVETHAPYTLASLERDVVANGYRLIRLAAHHPNVQHSVGFYRVAASK